MYLQKVDLKTFIKIKYMKNYIILPIVALILAAMSAGDERWSFSYLIKAIPAIVLILIAVLMLIKELKNQKKIW